MICNRKHPEPFYYAIKCIKPDKAQSYNDGDFINIYTQVSKFGNDTWFFDDRERAEDVISTYNYMLPANFKVVKITCWYSESKEE